MLSALKLFRNFKRSSQKIGVIEPLVPTFGVITFIAVYVIATQFYPGGSQANIKSVGFSWANNYWCNLLDELAINGQHNPARPIARIGMLILCVSMSIFWYVFPKYLLIGKYLRIMMQISGVVAMSISIFLATAINHDVILNLASIFGMVATAATFIGLYRMKWFWLFGFGLLNILLVGLNNYVYFNKELISYLPIIQKITFATFLSWICSIDIHLYRMQKLANTIRDGKSTDPHINFAADD